MKRKKQNLETCTHFYFFTNWLSNFARCSIIDPTTGIIFNSTEQAYMWHKANFSGDKFSRLKIEDSISPREAKDLGQLIAGYDDKLWGCVKYGFMVYVNYLKYSQNEDFKKKLISTFTKTLVEASPSDLVWGVGFSAEDPLILNENNWTGRNLLGKALMEVRDKIKGQQA